MLNIIIIFSLIYFLKYFQNCSQTGERIILILFKMHNIYLIIEICYLHNSYTTIAQRG
jgi:hypothetical protein